MVQQVPVKPSVTEKIDALNIDVTRDLLNRVKYNRGAALKGRELDA